MTSAYTRIRKAATRQNLDRDTWAGNTLVILSYDTQGVGVIQTGVLDFGIVYEGPPFFSYGVEVQSGQALVSGDFPEVSAGVASWEITEGAMPFYLGADLWITVRANSPYRLRFRLSFEGISMRNTEHFRGN